jgi:type I restriction enzyme R subunit
LIENKFDDFIISKGDYTSRQLEFLLLLRKVFADRKYVELPDFTKMPLGDEHPLDYFQMSVLKSIVAQCNEIKVCC